MYKRDHSGPWPQIDIGAAHTVRTDAAAYSAAGAALNVMFDTANLGGNNSAFISNFYFKTGGYTPTINQHQSFGVLLNSLDSLPSYNEGDNVLVDISMTARILIDEYAGKGPAMFAWIGYLDSGLTPSDGWDAVNNLVTNYHLLPASTTDDCLDVSTHVILTDILSGAFVEDEKIAIGFTAIQTADTNYGFQYTINAEYGTAPKAIYKRY